MILRQVREDQVVEEQIPDALLLGGVTRNFHDDRVGALLVHGGEERVEFEDIRRSAGGRFFAVLDLIRDGSYKSDGQACRAQEIADDIGGSRFAVRACHAYKLAFRLAVETVGQKGKRILVLGELDDRQVFRDQFRDFRYEDRRRASFRRVFNVKVAVGHGAFLGDKNEAGLDLAAV